MTSKTYEEKIKPKNKITSRSHPNRSNGLRAEITDARKKGWLSIRFGSFQTVDLDTILSFFTQFALLIRSGLPLFQSLEMVMEQTINPRMQEVLKQIRNDLINGKSLSEAMKRHYRIFTDLHISMILVGEGGGKLDLAFERIVKVLEDQRALSKKLKQVVNKVVGMVSLFVVVMIGILVFVFPKFAEIFTKVGMDLPMMTRAMIAASDFILTHKVALPLGCLGTGIALTLFIKSDSGLAFFDRAKVRIPGINTIVMNATLADFSRTLGSLLSTGVPMVQALEIARDATTNLVVRPILTELIRDVREGVKISESLARKKIFPNIMIQLTAAGENSGQLDVMMGNIHLYCKERVEESVARLTAVLEPLMLIVLGGMVLMMAASIFLPMFNLAGTVRRN